MRTRKSESGGDRSRLPRAARGLFRGRVLIVIAAPLLAVALVISMLPRPSSQAADLAGVQYEPGKANVTKSGDGCQLQLPITATAPNDATAKVLHDTVSNDIRRDLGGGTSTFLSPGPLEGKTVYFAAYVDGVKCQDYGESAPQSAARPAAGAGAVAVPVAYGPYAASAIPKWAKIAIAGLAAAAIFVGVTIVVGTGLEAAIGAGAATTVMGAALSGCVGGAVSTAVNNWITGASKTTKDWVSSAVVGCFTGGITAQLGPYLKPATEKMGAGLRSILGMAPAQVGGTVLQEVATEAAVDVSAPMIEMVGGAEQGMLRAAA